MNDDPYIERKRLTFAQAEGAVPLPQQLALGEVSPELRAKLWVIVHESLLCSRQHYDWTSYRQGSYLQKPWSEILYRKHILRDHRMADEFKNSFEDLSPELKQVFQRGGYIEIFDLLEWFLHQSGCPLDADKVQIALKTSRAAYRLLDDGKTIVPIVSDTDRQTLDRAFVDLAKSEFEGARTHLVAAASHLTRGDAAGSIRESIHAVESVARCLGGTNSLAGALQRLKADKKLHPALERSFKDLYGFTSDEKGIRHPLLDKGNSNVDETDAIFMIGACSAFVSYLVGKVRTEEPQTAAQLPKTATGRRR